MSKLKDNNSSFCSLAWSHFTIRPNGNIKPCCRSSDEWTKESLGIKQLDEVLNSQPFVDMRKKMLSAQPIEGCRKCYDEENSRGKSMRLNANAEFQVNTEEPRAQYLEIALGNLCNLKCRSCSSEFSSKWHEDEKIFNNKQHKILKPNTTWDFEKIDFSRVTKIKFIGGEPLINPEHIKILKILSKYSLDKVTLEYSTNGTVRINQETIELWKKCKHIDLTFSVDNWGSKNDFFRHGSQWDEIHSNMTWFSKLNLNNIKYYIHTVVSIYNIFDIIDLDNELIKNFPHFQPYKVTINYPTWLAPSNLPDFTKHKVKDLYEPLILSSKTREDIKKFYKLILDQTLQAPIDKFDNFIYYNDLLNNHWNVKGQYHSTLEDTIRQYKQGKQ